MQLKSVIVQDWQAPGAALAFDSSNYGEMATPWGKGKGERLKGKGERGKVKGERGKVKGER
ncbi:hypothetical protein VF14_32755 [Nostoc linckia z18]|uniref:Uncharacterized protein n=2 Tax=Nostoc linckia TaxID=92942 RepID=A0A9Q6EI10_NOSLI|nr:hypothetical protein VF02_37860 [Nostoc linckia z1]PHJ59347.1 hypothetical protein VF03_34730 [Nostoc linckia z2]PHJ63157.1 hypothetical protein VF05_25155 [Nostoc linckia z3]PHJ73977.1 hypothetical protein VF06_35600 [Nostoc linckia z4]PHJ88421.1 hypothetical protein VF07_16130 [Nostoc linckia z6]PHJ94621.1 hypothetical protein VF08_33400 [Nostoc linckia z8]PHJ96583.1 hypothetical protein VF04_15540 [Nostoc linckia z7]PHK08626.1 hypothetical protein VF11_37340 [Nostoc linckia z14]PHK164